MVKTKPEWPKIKVVYYPEFKKESEILTMEEAAAKYGLDESTVNWFRSGGLAGTTVKAFPKVQTLQKFTLRDSIEAAAPELLAALKEVVSILPASQEKLMKLGLDAWIYDAKAAIKKAETGEAL